MQLLANYSLKLLPSSPSCLLCMHAVLMSVGCTSPQPLASYLVFKILVSSFAAAAAAAAAASNGCTGHSIKLCLCKAGVHGAFPAALGRSQT